MCSQYLRIALALCLSLTGFSCSQPSKPDTADSDRQWLAGDHHIHSRFSVGWDRTTNPPTPKLGGDAIYPTPMNAVMGKYHGLSWIVTTDHGGPNHSKVNRDIAYPELLISRQTVPDVIQFYGMEFDTPGADHSSLIIPHTHDEVDRLFDIESRFAKNEPHPADKSWDTEPRMLEALKAMDQFEVKPLITANHPSRSATGLGEYGKDHPAELRDWNDTAPEIAVGMSGAPGHQAKALNPDGSIKQEARGSYKTFPTIGGFDQMTARLGGFWDSMLGEGRRWWITANSDSHIHWREGGSDFWPGEYSKTYVWAEKNHDDILNGIRHGRVFVTLGDLISELQVTASSGGESSEIGGTLEVTSGADVEVTIRFLDPSTLNAGEQNPSVARVDLITGQVNGHLSDRSTDTNPSTKVVTRFSEKVWRNEGPYRVMSYRLENINSNSYIRIRGTNGQELEPEQDPLGEDPWSDLWFYSNPIFVEVK
ncbi:phosphoesterase [Opitutia bacterium ISCC 51]|nr:phosphoesterase [Opitutae bacterium ISCC 51]QXD27319.1 phosphoesterase [Opitutae bacterium ISCC 52]